MRRIVIAATVVVVSAAAGTGVAAAGTIKSTTFKPSTIEYVLNGNPQTTMTETRTAPNTKAFRIPLGGKRYVLKCAEETPAVWYCGVREAK